ncbi:hypothetical protein FGW37_07195 [Streptomyces rectiverticillatus]|uniref:hypothetical protein n=1 Tax=Streptomyces rectiverticillatus TaxID=173860 RepID=UPI0015C2F9DA|nr:hypothetical protein [Streptomyces rectiverticillatus]QLE71407.1 hypothetical protein FGW37_07195 [Streptomyces rectiverticillatus]
MKLTKVAGEDPDCDSGDCADVFTMDQPGKIVVQGYLTDHPAPAGEAIVMIPERVLRDRAIPEQPCPAGG